MYCDSHYHDFHFGLRFIPQVKFDRIARCECVFVARNYSEIFVRVAVKSLIRTQLEGELNYNLRALENGMSNSQMNLEIGDFVDAFLVCLLADEFVCFDRITF